MEEEIFATIGPVGNMSSIIGLVITLFVFFTLRRIRRQYIFRIRGPQVIKKLTASASKIIDFLNYYPSTRREIHTELAIVEALVNSLKEKLVPSYKSSIKVVVQLVRKFRKRARGAEETYGTYDEVFAIYNELQKLIVETTECQTDTKWEM